jgi:outer membrane protein OmpA-like peptidoglycan-associated protein
MRRGVFAIFSGLGLVVVAAAIAVTIANVPAAAADDIVTIAQAQETERLAAEAKRKADEAKRNALEAEAERNAVAAARKAEAERAARQAPGGISPQRLSQTSPPVSDPSCDAAFAETFKSTDIRFSLNSVAVVPALSALIDRVAALTTRCASYSLDVAGHADSTGSDAIKLQTSLARAIAVRDALIARGVAASRLNARGYGDSRPLDPSPSRAAFERNRRVELSATAAGGGFAEAKTAGRKPATMRMVECHSGLSRALRRANIRFTENSGRITARYHRGLGIVARVVSRCPNHMVIINGHTDQRGSADANQKLSDARAQAIRRALMKRGVSADQLTAVGHGGLKPIAQGGTRAAFAQNRRVDFDLAVSAPPPQ